MTRAQKSGAVTYRGSRNTRWAFRAKKTSRPLHSGEKKMQHPQVREKRPFHTHGPPWLPQRPPLPHSARPGHSPTRQAAPEARSPRRLPGGGGQVVSPSSPLPHRSPALAATLTRSPSSPEGPGRPWPPVSPWKTSKQVRGASEPPTQADTDPLQLTDQFHPLSSCWDPRPPSLALRYLPANILTLCPFSPGSPGSPSKPRSP